MFRLDHFKAQLLVCATTLERYIYINLTNSTHVHTAIFLLGCVPGNIIYKNAVLFIAVQHGFISSP